MHGRAMITLIVVLDRQFPVGLVLDLGLTNEFQFGRIRVKAQQVFPIVDQLRPHRGRVFIQIDEDETAEFLDLDGAQIDLVAGQAVAFHRPRRAPQPAIQFIGPRMIGAHQDPLATALPFDDGMPPVTADIVIGVDLPLSAANDEDVLINDGEGLEVPGFRDLRYMTNTLPAAEEHFFLVDLKPLRFGIIFGG